jgi:membrane protein YdbS with pleckstrin-like domain
MTEGIYSAKPYMKKTIVKFVLEFIIVAVAFSPSLYILGTVSSLLSLGAFGAYSLFAVMYFVAYYFNKRAFVFFITDKSIRIQKSWVFGTYEREITLDQIRDIQISQGFLARFFDCGSLMFVTTSGLEVGYAHAGTGAGVNLGGILIGGGGASSTPHLLKGRGNTFWDIPNPSSVRQALIAKLSEWRGVVQEQKMAASLEKITEKMPSNLQPAPSTSLVGDLERLNALLEKGTITKTEYQKAKERLLKAES